jgi:hypothetical protein
VSYVPIAPHWVRGDFNGMLDDDLLCVAHAETLVDHAGREIALAAGLALVVYELDPGADGRPDALIAHGRVERSPDDVLCRGSRWSLRIDGGVCHWSELPHDARLQLLRASD